MLRLCDDDLPKVAGGNTLPLVSRILPGDEELTAGVSTPGGGAFFILPSGPMIEPYVFGVCSGTADCLGGGGLKVAGGAFTGTGVGKVTLG
jgi:hypothetical protein